MSLSLCVRDDVMKPIDKTYAVKSPFVIRDNKTS